MRRKREAVLFLVVVESGRGTVTFFEVPLSWRVFSPPFASFLDLDGVCAICVVPHTYSTWYVN